LDAPEDISKSRKYLSKYNVLNNISEFENVYETLISDFLFLYFGILSIPNIKKPRYSLL